MNESTLTPVLHHRAWQAHKNHPPEMDGARIGIKVANAIPSADLLTTAYAALDLVSHGIVLIDSTARVHFANQEAQRISKLADALTIGDGRLQFWQKTIQQRFENFLAGQCNAHTTTDSRLIAPLPRKSGARNYVLIVRPLAGQRRLYGCHLHDTDHYRSIAGDVLREIYGLTTTEAEVAALLFQGNSVEQVARLLAIRESTTRTHLTRILAKCEVRSLSTLLQQLALGPRT